MLLESLSFLLVLLFEGRVSHFQLRQFVISTVAYLRQPLPEVVDFGDLNQL